MCGITGYIDFNLKTEAPVLEAMSNCLAHRGPDSSGTFRETTSSGAEVALGHRRLSIIDLSPGGSQPMTFESLHITFNGEIYNFREIRAELEKTGHTFLTHSDTEVILHAYRQWGEKCLDRLIGMFAFVIYDSVNLELFCARDRAGVKPFFYYWQNDLFLFSSELKSFHKHPHFQKSLNLHAVASFVQFGNVPTPHCIFKHCYKLGPGRILKVDIARKQLKQSQYWDVYDCYNNNKLDIPFTEALDKTEQLLRSAFKYRMVADVPVGIFLSGGYDSACLTALLQQDHPQKLRTFTIGVPDIGLNEAPYARAVAEYLGTDHTEIMCTEKEVLDLIGGLPHFYDEPFADSSAIPTSLVCIMARRSVTVALSADGGDEVFAGYNRYDYLIKYQRLLNALPSLVRKSSYKLMEQLDADSIPFFSNTYNFHNRYEKLKMLLKDPSPKNMMLSLSKQYDLQHTRELFVNPVFNMNTAYQSNELLPEYYSPLSYMMAVDYQTYLLDDILQKVDRASMSASLEAREPFLDQRLIEWSARLPDHYKYHKGTKKYILKEIVHRHIPKKLMDRPKMGFAIPIESWLMTELRPSVEDFLSDDRISSQKIFNPEKVRILRREFLGGKKELALKIWYLLMFEMWYERWMK